MIYPLTSSVLEKDDVNSAIKVIKSKKISYREINYIKKALYASL